MPTLGTSRRQRFLSRVVFYLGLAVVLSVMGRLTEPELMSDEELGVAPVYIASPVWPGLSPEQVRLATVPFGR